MFIRDHDLNKVSRLWRELSEFPAAEPEEATRYCLKELRRFLGACNAFWVGATRDPKRRADDGLSGWRPTAYRILYPTEEQQRRVEFVLSHFEKDQFDPQTKAMASSAGATRAFLRPEIIDDRTWERSWLFQDILRPIRIHDRLIGAQNVSPDAESILVFDRGSRDTLFGDRERDLFRLFLVGCPSFHRDQLRARGLLDTFPRLSPREQEILPTLLTDFREREIAAQFGLTRATTHQYVVSILRKFGVSGRVGLMAHWLRFRGPAASGDRDALHGVRRRGLKDPDDR